MVGEASPRAPRIRIVFILHQVKRLLSVTPASSDKSRSFFDTRRRLFMSSSVVL